MKFEVHSEDSIKRICSSEPFAIISILSPGRNIDFGDVLNTSKFVGILNLRFHDIDDAYISNFEQWKKERNLISFDDDMAEQILTFMLYIKDFTNVIYIHCEAGISRSAGVASALAKIYNKDDSFYFKYYVPNRYVYSTILKTYYEHS